MTNGLARSMPLPIFVSWPAEGDELRDPPAGAVSARRSDDELTKMKEALPTHTHTHTHTHESQINIFFLSLFYFIRTSRFSLVSCGSHFLYPLCIEGNIQILGPWQNVGVQKVGPADFFLRESLHS
jgi:hypothetical protein